MSKKHDRMKQVRLNGESVKRLETLRERHQRKTGIWVSFAGMAKAVFDRGLTAMEGQ